MQQNIQQKEGIQGCKDEEVGKWGIWQGVTDGVSVWHGASLGGVGVGDNGGLKNLGNGFEGQTFLHVSILHSEKQFLRIYFHCLILSPTDLCLPSNHLEMHEFF